MLLIVVICLYKSFLNILQDLDVNLDSQRYICLDDFQRIYNFSNQTSFILKVKFYVGTDDTSFSNKCVVNACHEDFCCLCITVIEEKLILFVLPSRLE
jgi:hypothetical protein